MKSTLSLTNLQDSLLVARSAPVISVIAASVR